MVGNGKVYTAPDYNYEVLQNLGLQGQSVISGNGLVVAGTTLLNHTLSIYNRSTNNDTFQHLTNITLQKLISRDLLIDYNASTIMLCTFDIVNVYKNRSGVYRLVDSFPHLILTGDPNLRATPNLTVIVAFTWSDANNIMVNVFRYQEDEYTLNQTLKYNATNVTGSIMDVLVDQDILVVVFEKVVRILKMNKGVFQEVQTIKQETYVAIAKNRTLVTANNQTMYIWKRNDNGGEGREKGLITVDS